MRAIRLETVGLGIWEIGCIPPIGYSWAGWFRTFEVVNGCWSKVFFRSHQVQPFSYILPPLPAWTSWKWSCRPPLERCGRQSHWAIYLTCIAHSVGQGPTNQSIDVLIKQKCMQYVIQERVNEKKHIPGFVTLPIITTNKCAQPY